MMHYPSQGQFLPFIPRFSRPKRNFPSRHDRFFHLPTTIAQNDPFLQRVYGFVSLVLDDHPYPATPQAFKQRTYEIKENIRDLNLSPYEKNFLQRLMSETGVTLVDLWQGSHVITQDNGYLYHIWSQSPTANPRFSSHYRKVPLQQYGINFRDHQLLFGKTAIDGSTWFQMEAHGFDPDDPHLVVYHGQDFLKYRFHRMNVGPFGFSPHTEMFDPIRLSYQPSKLKTRQKQIRIDRLFRSHSRI